MDRADSINEQPERASGAARAALSRPALQIACKACVLGRTLWLLRELYPQAAMLDLDQLADAMGIPAKTLRNKVPHALPIPVQKIYGRWRVKLTDAAEAIDRGLFDEQKQRRRGRPRKDPAASELQLSLLEPKPATKDQPPLSPTS